MLKNVILSEHLSAIDNFYDTIYEVSKGDMRQAINLMESCAMQ